MNAFPPRGRVRFLGQSPSVAKRFGQEVLIASVRQHPDPVIRRPAGPLPCERGHMLVAVVHLIRRRSLGSVALVVAEDGAPPGPPQQLGLVAARTAGEGASRVVSLRGGGRRHASMLARPRVKNGWSPVSTRTCWG